MNINNPLITMALPLAILGIPGLAAAGSTATTSPIQGHAPVLTAPSNGNSQAVDLKSSNSEFLSSGDTITLTYGYSDVDGDADDSASTVKWYYVGKDNTETEIVGVRNTPASESGPGTSIMVLPATAIGAERIKVVISEKSTTGLPLEGNSLTIEDTSKGIGGGSVTAPGPVTAGGNIAGGIFLKSDNPAAGSGVTDYARANDIHPQVGATYVFRAWDDTNGNGVWDADEADLTASLRSIQWQLDGNNAAASGEGSATTLNNHVISGITGDTYIVPVNNASSSGAVPGDQGFSLKVDFN